MAATEVIVQPVSPEAARLARRLRQLRQQQWPDARLTQDKLARAFSGEEPLKAATVSSWESNTSPKLPPRHRLKAYARFFATQWTDGEQKLLAEDVGLLARVPNPLNSSRTLTICNGIHSRGVYGAVRTLTDTHLRDSNERYISANFGKLPFAILMSVKVIENKAVTPDFSNDEVVLYQWPKPTTA
jgi:hypothetical protein